MKPTRIILVLLLIFPLSIYPQRRAKKSKVNTENIDETQFKALKWRNIGPFRGGRSVASSGVVSDPMTYYMGSTGGGVWKTSDGGISWKNISDGFFKTGSVGAIAVAESDPNVIFVGMGEHAIRGVMTSSGDGVYKSTDAGKTWKHVGLDQTMHISDVIIHPQDPDVVFVAAQGAQYGASEERGIYKSTDGGESWKRVLFVSENTGASSLSMDMKNPRILYASIWQHRRYPWTIESGGEESGLYKSTDGGESWDKMEDGLPEAFGKSGISVSRANPDRLWAVIEAEGTKGGVYRSDDGGKKWSQINKDRVNIARSWYYMEIFADPQDENIVYVLNAPVMKSIDGGKSFSPLPTPHGDNHHLWINPTNNKIMINSNDGGANVSFNAGESWSSQQFQPTAQFYRVITDNRVPYYVYGGQQDNSAIAIASRTNDQGIDWKDWYSVAGCESAYLAFDPDNPEVVYGGCYQGIIEQWIKSSGEGKSIKEYPELALGNAPSDFKYRYNWNAPIISSPHDRNTIYHAGNVVFKTTDGGLNWEKVSPDLTRNNKDQQIPGGGPYTNEAAGGENYNTLMYLVESPHEKGVLWAGSDDGLLHLTRDGGANWKNVTPPRMQEGIINSIEVSPHDPGTAYIAVMRYKFNDLKPYIYKTSDYGNTWTKITDGIDDPHTFVRVVREDPKTKGLLYAGTETGLYISANDGASWQKFQLNLPVVPINDLVIQDNDLVAATAGRSFWILDDLGAIQQSSGKFGEGKLKIFSPKNTYRLFGGSSANTNGGQGQNPKEGVTFDYYLNKDIDSVSFKLKIFDQQNNLIRTYSNQPQKNFKSWPGGPQKPAVLSSKKGVNRFTWDFRRETLPAVDKVFVFGDYRGSRVAPGTYKLRLVMEKDSVETQVVILPNPKVKSTGSQFSQQQDFLREIENTVKDIHESVNSMRSAKNQLKSYASLLKGKKEAEELLEKGKAISERIGKWEEELIQPKQKTFQDVINFNNKLNAELLNLKSYVDAADPALTKGARERLADLKGQWKRFSDEKNAIISTEMNAYNDLYRQLGLPALILKD
ncbi:glycosyl hydrolase [Leptobacterium flavescens]|uniref:Glycosyl hydrolase n=1 Tax=Leptobacterium flavescens TaxID=472055 RepID=A0A6P0UHY8_9FLAO|nr:glycosyl hydrolase [Leptobacterium flavescens]NER12961.1 glycosyl hydrolase [Leptobacterium flavescens]